MNISIDLFEEILNQLQQDEKNKPVAQHIPSSELFDQLDLSLNDDPIKDHEFKEKLEALVLATPRTATKAFFNQLFAGRNEKAVLGDLLAVVLNNSMYTYKAAGPQIGVEKKILEKVIGMIGWNDQSGGTFAPGGSMTNFMSMLMARDRKVEAIRKSGFNAEKLTVYTSKESHYSIPKNAAFSGIGRNHVRYVKSSSKGELDVQDLKMLIEEDIAKGFYPALVNLTAGTTVLGAFDPIPEISELCEKHNIWLHVDGAYCGAVLFSEKYKYLIEGIEKVDSFSFNAHKMLGTPLSCSLILVKDKKYLYDSFANDAEYLYQTDHDEFNLGKTSLQCGRRNDALKFWTLWKSIGTKGLEEMVDHQFFLGDVARVYVKNHEDYQLYSYDNSISVCFNYKNIPANKICTLLYEHEQLLVGYGSFGEDEFIRLVTINYQNSKEDIINFFKTIEQFVEQHQELFELHLA